MTAIARDPSAVPICTAIFMTFVRPNLTAVDIYHVNHEIIR
jgi:hypothetical protein